MTRVMTVRVLVWGCVMVWALPVEAQPGRAPLQPIAPTSYDQCKALIDQWSAYTWRLQGIYQRCVSRNVDRIFQHPCQAEGRAHSEALRASETARTACYADVKAYLERKETERREQAEQERAAREAEEQRQQRLTRLRQEHDRMQNAWAEQQRERVEATRRVVEEQQRAAAEVEQRRREESRLAVNQALRDVTAAQDRAEAFKERAASITDRRVDLTAGDTRILDDMRRLADADGLRPRYVPAGPVSSTTPGPGLTSAVADLLGGEAESIVRWGLNRTETGERLLQSWDMADDFAGKYEALVSAYQYARSAWAGTATYEENTAAIVGGTGALATVAFSSTPAIAIQVTRVVGGVAATQRAGLYQIQMLAASDRALSADEIARLSDPRLPIQALFGASLPVDRIHRIERVWLEGARVANGGSFMTVFGR